MSRYHGRCENSSRMLGTAAFVTADEIPEQLTMILNKVSNYFQTPKRGMSPSIPQPVMSVKGGLPSHFNDLRSGLPRRRSLRHRIRVQMRPVGGRDGVACDGQVLDGARRGRFGRAAQM